MPYAELLRLTVLLIGGVGTALAIVSIGAATQDDDSTAVVIAAAWWTIALIGGVIAGTQARAAQGIAPALRSARAATSLPPESEGKIAFSRLWPIAAFALVCGGLAPIFPSVAIVGTGYAIFVALSWRRREAAVVAIEERDGVRFWVDSGSPFESVKLIRTPGLGRDRDPAGQTT